MPLKIKTVSGERELDDGVGQSLLALAGQSGVQVNARCAAEGICGGCTVMLEEGRFLDAQDRWITASPDRPCPVLACQTRLAGDDATIRFPRMSIVEQHAKIDGDFQVVPFLLKAQTQKYVIQVPEPDDNTQDDCMACIRRQLQQVAGHREFQFPVDVVRRIPASLRDGAQQLTVTVGRCGSAWSVIDVEPSDTRTLHFGVAIDVGTTTVVAMLVDLNQGRVLSKASLYNQQIRRADDVASRIALCRREDQVRELQRLIVDETINPLIESLCTEQGIQANSISRIAVSGNTVMAHLLLGISPDSIGHAPFQPVVRRYDPCRVRDLSLRANPNAIVDVIPSVSGYVGGDVVSDIYIARLGERPEATLLIDIGTNGEIVYSDGGQFSACATAAGPAFEGYGTSHGCRAAAGAIEHLSFAEDLRFEVKTIGGGPAIGLCGSAFIDFIADGMRCGLINHMGRYHVQQLHEQGRYLRVDEMCGPVHACVIVPADQSAGGEAIHVSERDISQILKAKAAIYAGMKTLLQVRRRQLADIHRFCLAGGFARHIDLNNAILIGLLPEVPLHRFELIGNGSLAGAMLALVDNDAMDAYASLAELPKVVELNRVASFENEFIDALALPNLKAEDFPRVFAEIARLRNQATD